MDSSQLIHSSVKIHPSARIDCRSLTIAAGGVVGERCVIEGARVHIGRDLWMDMGARIGGGSCHDPSAFLDAGDFLHLGKDSELNIARGVTLGDEVGIGIQTCVFTHGAYLDELSGFPVQFAPVKIGSRVWLPNAWVNPGVIIGDDVVVAARSLVNRDLPAGCLAGGVPVKVLRAGAFPRVLTEEERSAVLLRILNEANTLGACATYSDGCLIAAGRTDHETVFDLRLGYPLSVNGPVSRESELLRNQLRRHGIRFRYHAIGCNYEAWER